MKRHAIGLDLNDVDIQLDGRRIVALSHKIAPGEVLTVMGESGSGKTTLLNFVAGFLPPAFDATGRVVLDGVDVTAMPAERRQVGMLFQDPLLFPHMSVEGNLLYALPAGGSRAERGTRVSGFLESFGMGELGPRDPATLSGGQQARVALLRVLLAEPCALLLDEPFSKLDADRRDSVRKFVFELARERQLPVLLVTHDRADAAAAGGPMITL
jgi:putative thiamine transport system ATP-binding protein